MSNMTAICKACADLKININSQTPPILAREAIKTLLTRISTIVDTNTKKRPKKFRTEFKFTAVKRGEELAFKYPMRMEEILERMIVKAWSNDPNLIANQFALNMNNSKEDIDLVLHNGAEIETVIELKYGSNTPMFAVLEVIKNYFILKKGELHGEVKELTILAPKFFYNKFSSQYLQNVTEIAKNIRQADESIPEISFKYLNLSAAAIESTIREILSDVTTQCNPPKLQAKGTYYKVTSFEKEPLSPISNPLTNWQSL